MRGVTGVLFRLLLLYFFYPRDRGKRYKTVDYSEQVVSSVRMSYCMRQGEAPAVLDGGIGSKILRRVLKGHLNLTPSTNRKNMPILQRYLRLLKRDLNLEGCNVYRTCWALCLTQFEGVMCSEDHVRRNLEQRRDCNPHRDTHSGQISVEVVRGSP